MRQIKTVQVWNEANSEFDHVSGEDGVCFTTYPGLRKVHSCRYHIEMKGVEYCNLEKCKEAANE